MTISRKEALKSLNAMFPDVGEDVFLTIIQSTGTMEQAIEALLMMQSTTPTHAPRSTTADLSEIPNDMRHLTSPNNESKAATNNRTASTTTSSMTSNIIAQQRGSLSTTSGSVPIHTSTTGAPYRASIHDCGNGPHTAILFPAEAPKSTIGNRHSSSPPSTFLSHSIHPSSETIQPPDLSTGSESGPSVDTPSSLTDYSFAGAAINSPCVDSHIDLEQGGGGNLAHSLQNQGRHLIDTATTLTTEEKSPAVDITGINVAVPEPTAVTTTTMTTTTLNSSSSSPLTTDANVVWTADDADLAKRLQQELDDEALARRIAEAEGDADVVPGGRMGIAGADRSANRPTTIERRQGREGPKKKVEPSVFSSLLSKIRGRGNSVEITKQSQSQNQRDVGASGIQGSTTQVMSEGSLQSYVRMVNTLQVSKQITIDGGSCVTDNAQVYNCIANEYY